MSQATIVTLAILALAMALFLTDRVRADVVALLVAAALGVTGVLTAEEALAGFGSPAVITILAIFILAEGLRLTGVTDQVAAVLLRLSKARGQRLVTVVMGVAAFFSLFMNNVAAAALLLPAASRAGREARMSLARLLMPLAFATILGGTATLLTTTNIVVGDLLIQHGYRGYGLTDFAPLGLPVVAVGIAYMALVGRRLLPTSAPGDDVAAPQAENGLVHVYRLEERMFRVRVPSGSPLNGLALAASGFRELWGATVLAIEREGGRIPSPPPATMLRAGDVLVVEGRRETLEGPAGEGILELLGEVSGGDEALESDSIVVVEAVLSPRSTLIGHTLQSAHFREKYGMTALAVWRAGRSIRTGIRELTLAFGDALLLQGSRDRLGVLRSEPDLILLFAGREKPPTVPRKGKLAVGILVLTLAAVASGWPPIGVGMLAGAVAMLLAGVLTVEQAYQAVEWRTVFLVAGMLPVSTALAKSGAAEAMAVGLAGWMTPLGPLALLAGVFIVGVGLTQVMSGTAVAFVLAPVAILTAKQMGLDPRSLGMGVVLATSMAFLTPLGHPVNVLVMGPAGYRFRDFLRVGLPLVVLLFLLILGLLPLIWPLVPHP